MTLRGVSSCSAEDWIRCRGRAGRWHKEARETNYWLRLLVASDMVPEAKLKDLLDESHQLIAILTSIIKTTRKNME